MSENMNMDVDYATFVDVLAKDKDSIVLDLVAEPHKAHLMHMAVGLSTEVGEINTTLKKHCIYNQEVDQDNILEEGSDILFYLQGIFNVFGMTIQDALKYNVKKLKERYHDGYYSDEQAQERADKLEGE